MFKKLSGFILFLSLLLASGCAELNRSAKEVGKAGGQVISVPSSVSEGVSEGVAGEPESNPYKR